MSRRDALKSEAAWMGILTCTCGKRAHLSRGHARKALRRLFHGRDGMQVYRCLVDGEFWHFGHPRGYERER